MDTRITAGSKRPQIAALTGLRFFAAFFILFAHSVDWNAQFSNSEVRRDFTFVDMYGMPLFFVLSGFVIHYNYRDMFVRKGIARATCEFAAARFARLYPLFFAMLLMAISADSFVQKISPTPHAALSILGYFVTLTQSWWYVVYNKQMVMYWLFPLSWSVSTEMFFYAAYVAVIYLVLILRGPRRSLLIAAGFAMASYVLFVVAYTYLDSLMGFFSRHIEELIPVEENPQNSFFRWISYFSPYTRIFEFLLGCLTAHAFMELGNHPVSRREQRIGIWAQRIAFMILFLFALVINDVIVAPPLNLYCDYLVNNFLCAGPIAVLIFCASRYETGFSRWMAVPVLVTLGECSYSIYLTHTWTLRLFSHPPVPLNILSAVDAMASVSFGIILTLLLSQATYKYIELPGRSRCRRLLGKLIAHGFGDKQCSAPEGNDRPLPPLSKRAWFTIGSLAALTLIAVGGQRNWLSHGMHGLRYWLGARHS